MNMIYAPQTPPPSNNTLHPWLPQTFDQLVKFSQCLANSHLVPNSYKIKVSRMIV